MKIVISISAISLFLALLFQILALYDVYEVWHFDFARISKEDNHLGYIVIAMLFFASISIGCFIWTLKKLFSNNAKIYLGILLLVVGGVILMLASLFAIMALFSVYSIYIPVVFMRATIIAIGSLIVAAIFIVAGYYTLSSKGVAISTH